MRGLGAGEPDLNKQSLLSVKVFRNQIVNVTNKMAHTCLSPVRLFQDNDGNSSKSCLSTGPIEMNGACFCATSLLPAVPVCSAKHVCLEVRSPGIKSMCFMLNCS